MPDPISTNQPPIVPPPTFPEMTDIPTMPPDTSGDMNIPPIITSPAPRKGRGKIVATILGILLLVGAVGAGVILVGQKQLFEQKAACYEDEHFCSISAQCCSGNCNQSMQKCIPSAFPDYTPTPGPTPTPSPECSGTTDCGAQTCDNCTQVCCETGCAPIEDGCGDGGDGGDGGGDGALPPARCTPGCYGAASGHDGNWKCKLMDGGFCRHAYDEPNCQGTSVGCNTRPFTSVLCGCPAKPTPTPTPGPNAVCSAVKAYDTNWNLLTSAQLSALSAGDIVRFTVSGTPPDQIDDAKFFINGAETAKDGKGTGTHATEFYVDYTIPPVGTSFTVTAQVHHLTLGWF